MHYLHSNPEIVPSSAQGGDLLQGDDSHVPLLSYVPGRMSWECTSNDNIMILVIGKSFLKIKPETNGDHLVFLLSSCFMFTPTEKCIRMWIMRFGGRNVFLKCQTSILKTWGWFLVLSCSILFVPMLREILMAPRTTAKLDQKGHEFSLLLFYYSTCF